MPIFSPGKISREMLCRAGVEGLLELARVSQIITLHFLLPIRRTNIPELNLSVPWPG